MRDSDTNPDSQNPDTLRAYTVPADRVEALRSALSTALGKNGTTSLAGPDKILVLAPAILQSSIADTIAELVKDAPEPVVDLGPVRMQLWVVDVTDEPSMDPRLDAIAPALEAVKPNLNAAGFALYTQLALHSGFSVSNGPTRQTSDDRAHLNYRMVRKAEGVVVWLNVNVGRMRFETETPLAFGETVVLAQASPERGESRVRLILVRVDAVN